MTQKTANLLGALSLAIAGRIDQAIEEELGIGGIASSALVVIEAEDGMTVERLAKLLKMSQSSMVRAVQQLTSLGLITKRAAQDKRVLTLHITKAGHSKLKTLLRRRAKILDGMIGVLGPKASIAFNEALEQLLEALVSKPDDKFSICRLCDEDSCGAYEDCPVERGAKRAEMAHSKSDPLDA